MDTEDRTQQFTQLVLLSCRNHRHIDHNEEEYLLHKAVGMGLDVDAAIAIIRQVCISNKVPLQRDVDEHCAEILQELHGTEGCITYKGFTIVCHIYAHHCYNSASVPVNEIKRRLKRLIIRKGWSVKEGWFFHKRWFFEIA